MVAPVGRGTPHELRCARHAGQVAAAADDARLAAEAGTELGRRRVRRPAAGALPVADFPDLVPAEHAHLCAGDAAACVAPAAQRLPVANTCPAVASRAHLVATVARQERLVGELKVLAAQRADVFRHSRRPGAARPAAAFSPAVTRHEAGGGAAVARPASSRQWLRQRCNKPCRGGCQGVRTRVVGRTRVRCGAEPRGVYPLTRLGGSSRSPCAVRLTHQCRVRTARCLHRRFVRRRHRRCPNLSQRRCPSLRAASASLLARFAGRRALWCLASSSSPFSPALQSLDLSNAADRH